MMFRYRDYTGSRVNDLENCGNRSRGRLSYSAGPGEYIVKGKLINGCF